MGGPSRKACLRLNIANLLVESEEDAYYIGSFSEYWVHDNNIVNNFVLMPIFPGCQLFNYV
jgi:hypothetical protein